MVCSPRWVRRDLACSRIRNGDGVDKQDILLTGGTEFVQFDFDLGGALLTENLPIDFDVALPGLGLQFGAGDEFDLTVDWRFSLGFGLSLKEGIYFDVSTENEFQVDVDARVNEGFSAQATLGKFHAG